MGGCRISVVLITRHATHAKGSERVSAAYKGTHDMHDGGGEADRGGARRGREEGEGVTAMKTN